MNAWQPIDTAPKDTPVLIWCPDVYKDNQITVATLDDKMGWQLVQFGSYASDAGPEGEPVKWMSLPEKPQ